MSGVEKTALGNRKIWMPIVASLAALAVGVGAFAIAAPFAAPRTVEPELLDAWVLPTSTGLTPLAFEASEPQAPIDELLSPTTVSTADPASPASVRAAMEAMVAERAALDREVPDSLVVPLGRLSSADVGLIGSDPCALVPLTGGACPDGARATVLDTDFSRPLALSLSNQLRCVDGERQRNDFEFMVYTNRPVSLTVEYRASTDTRMLTIETTDDAREAWLDAGAQGLVWHCIALTELPPNWGDTVRILATDERGGTAELERRLNWIDTGAEPPSWVEPMSDSGVIISIPAKFTSTVRFLAFAVPFGQDAPVCDFDDVENAIQPFEQIRAQFSPQQLRDLGYREIFTERHTASFVVPEASTVSVCAGWVNNSYVWEGNIPDEIYGQVLHSPDLAYPRVSVVDAEVDGWIDENPVLLTARSGVTGDPCGSSWRTNMAVGRLICDLTPFAAEPEPTWNDALVVSTRRENTRAGSERLYTFSVTPQVCGPGCSGLDPIYLDVPLPVQNECIGNTCPDVERSWVRLKVDWVDGQDSWLSDWGREDTPPEGADTPVLDRSLGITVGAPSADGLTAAATAAILTDREVTMRAELSVVVSFSPDSARISRTPDVVIVDDEFLARRTIDLGALEVETAYALTVTLTDREGNVSRYSGDYHNYRGLGWPAGYLFVESVPLGVRATLTASRPDRGPVVVGETAVTIGSAAFTTIPRSTWFHCGIDDYAVIRDDYQLALLRRTVAVRVRSEAFIPSALGADDDTCPSILPRRRGEVPTIDQVVRVPLDQLLAGTTITLESSGLELRLRLKADPRS